MSVDIMGNPNWSIEPSRSVEPSYSLDQIFKYLSESDNPNIVAIDEFQQRGNLIPALDLAADLDLDLGRVAVEDDVDGVLHSGTEDETAFHQ